MEGAESMFDIKTSRDFLAKLKADFAEFEREPGSPRLALNFAITAHHLPEWVWGDWLKTDYATWKKLRVAHQPGRLVRDFPSFREWVFNVCPWQIWMESLANGTKHFSQPPFQALRVSALPFALDTPEAGLDEGAWDGPMPYTTGERVFLLIDNGPGGTEVHNRYMPVGSLLHAVLCFWKSFFERYAPEPSKSSTNIEAQL